MEGFAPGFGFDGLIAALLANGSPLGTIAHRRCSSVRCATGSLLLEVDTAGLPRDHHGHSGPDDPQRFGRCPACGAVAAAPPGSGDGNSRAALFGVTRCWWRRCAPRRPILLVSLGGAFTTKAGIFNIGLEGQMLIGAFFAVHRLHLRPIRPSSACSVASRRRIDLRADLRRAGGHLSGQRGGGRPRPEHPCGWHDHLADEGDLRHPGLDPRARHRGSAPPACIPGFRGVCSVPRRSARVWLSRRWSMWPSWPCRPSRCSSRGLASGSTSGSAGEKPEAAEALGIPVARMRFIASLLCGLFWPGSRAPTCLSATSPCSPRTCPPGRGFMAVAILIFSAGDPFKVLGRLPCCSASPTHVSLRLQTFGFPSYLVLALPYAVALARAVHAVLPGASAPGARDARRA